MAPHSLMCLANNPRIIFVPLFVHSIFKISPASASPFYFHWYHPSLDWTSLDWILKTFILGCLI